MLASAAIGIAACGGDDSSDASDGGDGGASGEGGIFVGPDGGSPPTDGSGPIVGEAGMPTGSCNAVEEQHPLLCGGPGLANCGHYTTCVTVTYETNPPTSGKHYEEWASYRTYTDPLAQIHYVHNLEHGGVVFLYNCPNGCADEVAAAQSVLDALPDDQDPNCVHGGVRRRTILTPDPKSTAKWAAAAWGWSLRADCFDAEAFKKFAIAHNGNGAEDVCEDGAYPPPCGGQ